MKIKQGRFNGYNPFGDLSDPELVGVVANDEDWNLGTPNLERRENITLIASNSSLGQCLEVRLKWRPNADAKTVTMVSRMTFIIGQDVYEFSQVESYQPSFDCCRRPGRIGQYGSSSSKLKLITMSPYRRARIIFNGHMQHVSDASGPVGSDQEPRLVFIKLSCVVNAVSEIYDFLGRINEACLRKIYDAKKPKKSFDAFVNELVHHDRHEQRVKLYGEYLLVENNSTQRPPERRQEAIQILGYHARHFLTDNKELTISTARLYAYINNGQGFQVCTRKSDDLEIDFGYTAFHPHPKIDFIEKPVNLENKLDADLNKFSIEVSGHQSTFEFTGKRHVRDWFEVDLDGKPGWAWLSLDDELVESHTETVAIEKCRAERERSLQSGQICRVVELDPDLKPLVVSIEEECCESSDLVGAKASSLAQLHKFVAAKDNSDIRVPQAVVVTRFAHDLLIEENPNLKDAINELRQSITSGNVSEECKKVQDLIKATSLPEQIADELWSKLAANQMVGEGATFAVRSSSWGEDEADMSAAGQLSTILNVKCNLDELKKAVMECFASKFSNENIEYKRQHGQPFDLPMAVVVQRMIPCDKAGVMFTCDPTNGDESIITITANYGLGESVVSAQADPDSIRVRVGLERADYTLDAPPVDCSQKELKIEEIVIGKKAIIINNESDQQYDRSKCCLNEAEILQLAKCGLMIKRYFWSQRRDIEWGYKDGQLHLFQSRPVTGLDNYTLEELLREMDKSSPRELCYYSRANVGEVMPNAARPLTLTFPTAYWNVIAYRMFQSLIQDPNSRFMPHATIEVVYEKYHCLFTVSNSIFLSLDSDNKSTLAKSMEIGFFGREIGSRPDIVENSRGFMRAPQPFEGNRFKLYTWQLRLMPVRTVEKELPILLRLRDQIRNLKLAEGYASNKLLGLYNQMCAALRGHEMCWKNHLSTIILSTNSNMGLTAVLSSYIKDAKQLCSATNRFLAISPDVISAEIPARVRKMAELIRAKGLDEAKKFAAMSSDEALKYLLNEDDENKSLKSAYEEFMTKFGHRCYNEFELAAAPWREDPGQVVNMIQMNCSALTNENGLKETDRDKTIDDVIKSLNIDLSLKDWLIVKHMLAPKSQLMLSLREKTKNILVLFGDILREASRMLAAEMVRQQRIPDEDLIYYLTLDELKPLVMDYQPAIVMHAVKRRQMFKKMFSELWKFDEIFTDVTPNHLKDTKELDEAIAQAPRLSGTPASSGKVQGVICRVDGYHELNKVRPGTILLTHSTDIAFSPVFPMITGIITEVGGLVSHGAVVAREYGLPSLIGIPDVMRILQDGEEIILDADNGTIIRLSKSADRADADQQAAQA
jgi:phosphohistidine swiveling domain-containing protein